MVKIEITSAQVHERTVTPKSGRAAFVAREQDGYAYTFDRSGVQEKHPAKITINLDRDQAGYAEGFYTLLPESLYVGKFGQLEIGRLKLKALAVPQAKAA